MSASVTDSLAALNNAEREARNHASRANELEIAQKCLSEVRNSDLRSFSGWIGLILSKWNHRHETIAKDALDQVLNECKHDLVRLAELRLAAMAREEKIKAAQKRAVIMASIIDIGAPK